ncbi:MAG: type VI secretion system baseplate subunit TssK [Paracoccus sp. (in: a-proteobacteria)]|uniref:type VI secretion system baseplate subunit TssK n=1 Tax=Paracoccus sp. TaxID=267 RepID=UPI0026E011B2|nr:type VI secretion system baseplate subunit TssK [Paracoccus sp. (in: a-proteobacteria)]MDO5622785.1 type VI secretion system baseplate subunit TssK [Paracoccus sp. (in: a-proteobacteria)]
MSWYSKVAWKEGLFLQPQHFQQADRYTEHLIQSRTRAITPYPWGVTEVSLDKDRAQQGMLGLRSVSGLMPDGTPFDAPGISPLPRAIAVPDDAAGQFVWLTLPDVSPNVRDSAPYDEEDSSTRWGIVAETVGDSAAVARTEQVLELAVPRLELAIRKTPRPGYQNLRLARIAEVRDRVVTLDDTLPPPSLVIGAHPQLLGYLTRVIGWIEARLESLARYAADPSAGGGMQAVDYLMLLTLNREIGLLRHLSRSFVVHPETLYQRLLSLAGELATFNEGSRMAPDYPPYDHEDPKASFGVIVADIQRLLSRDIGRAVRLVLRQVRPNSYLAEVADRNLFREATFVIEVQTAKPLTQVQSQFPELCKIGPNTRMSEIVNNNLPGIALHHLPNPPRQIRVLSSNVYFRMEKSSPLWREFSMAPGIGMHFAGDWPDLKLELWAVPEKG